MSSLPIIEEPWYKEGLKFKCTGCGGCCTKTPGYVWVSDEEMAQMAAHLKLSIAEFAKKYLRQIDGRFSLKELRPHFDCIFLNGKRCSIYEVRPTQCRTYPFWPTILSSKEKWEEERLFCEGIAEDSPTVPLAEISQQLESQVKKGFLLKDL